MSVGILDMDMQNYCPFPYNLEVMKLSSYYKKHNQIVSLASGFYPEKYSKFIIRKDIIDNDYIPNMLSYNNVEYGGYGFTNGIYLPLAEEIELSQPDVYIYNKVQANYEKNKTSKDKWLLMKNAAHLRVSLDGRAVWSDYLKPINLNGSYTNTFIHDLNISGIQDGDLAVKDLILSYKKLGKALVQRLGFKFPIQVENFDQLKKWWDIGGRGAYKNFQLNGIFKDEELIDICNLLPRNNILKMVYKVDIPQNLSNQDFILLMRKIYKQTIFLHNEACCLSLIVGDNFPQPEKWQKVFDGWNCYLYAGQTHHKEQIEKRKDFETFFNYCKRIKEYKFKKEQIARTTLPIEEFRQIFDFIGHFDEELFEDFYTLNSVELKGGDFICKRRTK